MSPSSLQQEPASSESPGNSTNTLAPEEEAASGSQYSSMSPVTAPAPASTPTQRSTYPHFSPVTPVTAAAPDPTAPAQDLNYRPYPHFSPISPAIIPAQAPMLFHYLPLITANLPAPEQAATAPAPTQSRNYPHFSPVTPVTAAAPDPTAPVQDLNYRPYPHFSPISPAIIPAQASMFFNSLTLPANLPAPGQATWYQHYQPISAATAPAPAPAPTFFHYTPMFVATEPVPEQASTGPHGSQAATTPTERRLMPSRPIRYRQGEPRYPPLLFAAKRFKTFSVPVVLPDGRVKSRVEIVAKCQSDAKRDEPRERQEIPASTSAARLVAVVAPNNGNVSHANRTPPTPKRRICLKRIPRASRKFAQRLEMEARSRNNPDASEGYT